MIEFLGTQMQLISNALESIKEETLFCMVEQTACTLASSHRVIVTGLGKNVPICEKFVGTMVSMGLDTTFMNTDSAVHGDMGCIRDGDMVIFLSKSGETEESIRLAKELLRQDRQISSWLITFRDRSTLQGLIQNCLVMDLQHEGDQWNIMPVNSSTIDLIVLQSLAILTAKRLGISIEQFRRNHPGGAIGLQLRNDV